MGNPFSSLIQRLFQTKKAKALLLGLDGVGKTTILYKLKTGETAYTMPTIGFNGNFYLVESIQYGNFQMTIWDMGGQDKIRQLWSHYFSNTDCLIWVVDSADETRLDIVAEELRKVLKSFQNISLLVLANKQDMNEAVTPSHIADKLDLYSLDVQWSIQPACALSGEGLESMLRWIASQCE